jgi:hypothetical protein
VEVTKEQLVQLRDDQQLSWAKVATTLGLGSPGAARRAYSQLVRAHTESVLAGRPSANGRATVHPVQLAGASLTTVRKALVGKVAIVQRSHGKTEEVNVVRVTSVSKGNVNFNDGHKSRTVKLEAIVATR